MCVGYSTHNDGSSMAVWELHHYSFIHRLVGGLASEKVRWAESVEQFKQEELTLAGDVLLTSSYLSYVGCFGRPYRLELLEDKWMPFLASLDVRMQFCATVQIGRASCRERV